MKKNQKKKINKKKIKLQFCYAFFLEINAYFEDKNSGWWVRDGRGRRGWGGREKKLTTVDSIHWYTSIFLINASDRRRYLYYGIFFRPFDGGQRISIIWEEEFVFILLNRESESPQKNQIIKSNVKMNFFFRGTTLLLLKSRV